MIAVSLFLGLVFGFLYWVSLDSTTIVINGKAYIKGELTKTAKEDLLKNPSVSEEDYFLGTGKKDFGSK